MSYRNPYVWFQAILLPLLTVRLSDLVLLCMYSNKDVCSQVVSGNTLYSQRCCTEILGWWIHFCWLRSSSSSCHLTQQGLDIVITSPSCFVLRRIFRLMSSEHFLSFQSTEKSKWQNLFKKKIDVIIFKNPEHVYTKQNILLAGV